MEKEASLLRKALMQKICALVSLSLLLSISFVPGITNASAVSEVSGTPIIIDGNPIQTTYFMQNGYLMVPALFFQNTGVTVDWNDQNQSVVLKRNNILLALPSGKNYADYFVKDTYQWHREYLFTTTTDLSNGTYIPLQYAAEKLGMKVSYNSKTLINTNSPSTNKRNIFYKGNTSTKKVALTFDDGPDNYYTPQILDILHEKGVTATFFIVGQQAKSFPEMLKRIVREGHALGNHSWDHPQLPSLNTSQLIQEVQSTETEIQRITGRKPDLFRPPYGLVTNKELGPLQGLGYRVINWSVDTTDWKGLSDDQILSIVNKQVSSGVIILQHCLAGRPGRLDGTVKALPKIIDLLRNEGYEFVTVQTLLENE